MSSRKQKRFQSQIAGSWNFKLLSNRNTENEMGCSIAAGGRMCGCMILRLSHGSHSMQTPADSYLRTDLCVNSYILPAAGLFKELHLLSRRQPQPCNTTATMVLCTGTASISVSGVWILFQKKLHSGCGQPFINQYCVHRRSSRSRRFLSMPDPDVKLQGQVPIP